jgi:ABC-type transporter Mla subunit MlaD
VSTYSSSDRLLDQVTDLSKLSERQLLERIVRNQERMATQMANDTSYIDAALQSLDTQLSDLGTRTQNMADALRQATADATDLQDLRDKVNGYADRIQADAVSVLNMAQPSAVANPETPDQATPVPTDPETPISA